jgi:hypothetical protein
VLAPAPAPALALRGAGGAARQFRRSHLTRPADRYGLPHAALMDVGFLCGELVEPLLQAREQFWNWSGSSRSRFGA